MGIAGRRDRGKVRRRASEVDLCRRCTAERLMRAEVRVVDEAQPDLLHQIFRHQRPQQAQAEGEDLDEPL